MFPDLPPVCCGRDWERGGEGQDCFEDPLRREARRGNRARTAPKDYERLARTRKEAPRHQVPCFTGLYDVRSKHMERIVVFRSDQERDLPRHPRLRQVACV